MAKVIIKKTKKMMPALLPPGAIMDIAKVLGHSRTTVWGALRKNRQGEAADKIRTYVLEKYGTEVEGNETINE